MNHSELATLSQAVYSPTGIDGAENIGLEGARCAILRGMMGRPTVAVFRGSKDVAGWVDDADVRMVPGTWGAVHAGFQREWADLRALVLNAVGDSPVILTGHSLGGALATLAAADLPNASEVTTFGSPRPGGAEFAANYRAHPIGLLTTRYVNQLDPVAWVPPWLSIPYLKIGGFRHVCSARWHNGDEWQDGYDIVHLAKLAYHMTTNMVFSFGSWKAWVEKFAEYHHVDRYVEAFAQKTGGV